MVMEEIDEGDYFDEGRIVNSRCIFYGNVRYEISECRLYFVKIFEEWMSVLKEKGVCWFCLNIGYCICDCRRKKICGENGCIRIY